MKFTATLSAFATVVAIIYGVLFSITYPRVDINGGIVALCAVLGIVTCFCAVGLWKLIAGSKQ